MPRLPTSSRATYLVRRRRVFIQQHPMQRRRHGDTRTVPYCTLRFLLGTDSCPEALKGRLDTHQNWPGALAISKSGSSRQKKGYSYLLYIA